MLNPMKTNYVNQNEPFSRGNRGEREDRPKIIMESSKVNSVQVDQQNRKDSCPQCQSQSFSISSRLIQEACGHIKCRNCLMNESSGCIQCLQKIQNDELFRNRYNEGQNLAAAAAVAAAASVSVPHSRISPSHHLIDTQRKSPFEHRSVPHHLEERNPNWSPLQRRYNHQPTQGILPKGISNGCEPFVRPSLHHIDSSVLTEDTTAASAATNVEYLGNNNNGLSMIPPLHLNTNSFSVPSSTSSAAAVSAHHLQSQRYLNGTTIRTSSPYPINYINSKIPPPPPQHTSSNSITREPNEKQVNVSSNSLYPNQCYQESVKIECDSGIVDNNATTTTSTTNISDNTGDYSNRNEINIPPILRNNIQGQINDLRSGFSYSSKFPGELAIADKFNSHLLMVKKESDSATPSPSPSGGGGGGSNNNTNHRPINNMDPIQLFKNSNSNPSGSFIENDLNDISTINPNSLVKDDDLFGLSESSQQGPEKRIINRNMDFVEDWLREVKKTKIDDDLVHNKEHFKSHVYDALPDSQKNKATIKRGEQISIENMKKVISSQNTINQDGEVGDNLIQSKTAVICAYRDSMQQQQSEQEPVNEKPKPKRKRKRNSINHENFNNIVQKKEFDPPEYLCTVCNRQFKNRLNIRYHIACADKSAGHHCKECSRVFKSSSHLTYHMRTMHGREKPYKCKSCDKAFAQSVKLKRHEMTHTGERPFRCQTCESSFTTKYNLKEHENIHKSKRPYICMFCGTGFADRNNLRRHEAGHSQDKKKPDNNTQQKSNRQRNPKVFNNKEEEYTVKESNGPSTIFCESSPPALNLQMTNSQHPFTGKLRRHFDEQQETNTIDLRLHQTIKNELSPPNVTENGSLNLSSNSVYASNRSPELVAAWNPSDSLRQPSPFSYQPQQHLLHQEISNPMGSILQTSSPSISIPNSIPISISDLIIERSSPPEFKSISYNNVHPAMTVLNGGCESENGSTSLKLIGTDATSTSDSPPTQNYASVDDRCLKKEIKRLLKPLKADIICGIKDGTMNESDRNLLIKAIKYVDQSNLIGGMRAEEMSIIDRLDTFSDISTGSKKEFLRRYEEQERQKRHEAGGSSSASSTSITHGRHLDDFKGIPVPVKNEPVPCLNVPKLSLLVCHLDKIAMENKSFHSYINSSEPPKLSVDKSTKLRGSNRGVRKVIIPPDEDEDM